MKRDDTRAVCPLHAPAVPAIDYFDPAFKAGVHDTYTVLRTEAPVHRIVHRDGRPLWLITRHEDVRRVLRDPRFVKDRRNAFTAAELDAQPPLPPVMRYLHRHLLAADPPQHTRLRRLVQRAFAPRLIEALRPRIQRIADALLERALPRGSIELIDEYANLLPITVLAELLGVPAADHALFRQWSTVLVANTGTLDQRSIAALTPTLEAFSCYLRDLFERKRRRPGADLISQLVAGDDPAELDEDESIAMLLLLIVAGHETTTHLIGNGVLALLQHPGQLARLVDDPGLLPNAIEELLRFDGPVETSTLRYAREDIAFSGSIIARGDLVMVVLASANRDELSFDQAAQLDIARDCSRHVAFGHGIHYCLGAALARLEGEIALGTLLRRARGLRLAADAATLRWRAGPLTRGLQALPLVFDAVACEHGPARGNPYALWFWAADTDCAAPAVERG